MLVVYIEFSIKNTKWSVVLLTCFILVRCSYLSTENYDVDTTTPFAKIMTFSSMYTAAASTFYTVYSWKTP